jgi:hypothetical protein
MTERRVENQFDSWPLKVKNCHELCVCRWCATYSWKAFDKGCNFSWDLVSIKGLHKKLWASKVMKVPILGISGLLTWESREKWHLSVAPMANHRKYYKGEGGGFPKSVIWWILWICVCSWFVRALKMFQLCTNQLVLWFMEVHITNWPTCHLF